MKKIAKKNVCIYLIVSFVNNYKQNITMLRFVLGRTDFQYKSTSQ